MGLKLSDAQRKRVKAARMLQAGKPAPRRWRWPLGSPDKRCTHGSECLMKAVWTGCAP